MKNLSSSYHADHYTALTQSVVPSVGASYDNELPLPRANTTNFFYSFSFLPKDEREAMHHIYAFCRYTDDIVDESWLPTLTAQTLPLQETDETIRKKRERLQRWRSEVDKCYEGTSLHPILRPLTAVVQRFSIPKQYLHILIDGCERDLMQTRYQTFEELKEYCFGVAGIVGLMSIEIFGYKYDDTKEYAVHLGYALQLTNIMRDVKVDKDKGRIYLPLEDLERFHITEDDIFREQYSEKFVDLMQFQARRTREYYHKARAALRPDEGFSMFAAQIMDGIYYRLLEKIELANFDVFHNKIRVSTSHKLLIALRLWAKTRLLLKRA
jgi:15-cis-phytoene synthase